MSTESLVDSSIRRVSCLAYKATGKTCQAKRVSPSGVVILKGRTWFSTACQMILDGDEGPDQMSHLDSQTVLVFSDLATMLYVTCGRITCLSRCQFK